MKTEPDSEKEENKHSRQEREDLMIESEAWRSALFRRIPRTQISDECLQKALERIQGSIDDFVYDVMRDVDDDDDDDALYNLCRKEQRQQQQQKQKKPNPKRRDTLDHVITGEDIRVWGPYECSNFYILSVLIQKILDEFVFANKYPLGITTAQIKVLDEVEKGMRYVSKNKGKIDYLP